MRSFIDNDGKVAWIFDEDKHPNGEHKEQETSKFDLNKDGKVDEKDVSIAGQTLSHSKKRK